MLNENSKAVQKDNSNSTWTW